MAGVADEIADAPMGQTSVDSIDYARADVTPPKWLPVAWYFVTAIFSAFLGIAAFAISAWDVRTFNPGFDDDFSELIGKIVRHTQFSGFVYFCGFACILGLIPRSPKAFTGPLMVSPYMLALVIDLATRPTSHNLLPFELLTYLALAIAGSIFAMLGVFVRSGIFHFLPGSATRHARPDVSKDLEP